MKRKDFDIQIDFYFRTGGSASTVRICLFFSFKNMLTPANVPPVPVLITTALTFPSRTKQTKDSLDHFPGSPTRLFPNFRSSGLIMSISIRSIIKLIRPQGILPFFRISSCLETLLNYLPSPKQKYIMIIILRIGKWHHWNRRYFRT